MTSEEARTGRALAFKLWAWIDRLFPDADRAEPLKRALEERFGDDTRAVSSELCGEIEAVAHGFSRHFALEYVGMASSRQCGGQRRGRLQSVVDASHGSGAGARRTTTVDPR
jgi:hypothetical protein